MTDLTVIPRPNEWLRLKSMVLDSVSSPTARLKGHLARFF